MVSIFLSVSIEKVLTGDKVASKGCYCCIFLPVKITVFSTIELTLLIICSQELLFKASHLYAIPLFSVSSGNQIPLGVPSSMAVTKVGLLECMNKTGNVLFLCHVRIFKKNNCEFHLCV